MAGLLFLNLVPVPRTIADPDTMLTVPVVYIMNKFPRGINEGLIKY